MNSELTGCMCRPQPGTFFGHCVQCGQPVQEDVSALTGTQLAKMNLCGNCDRDQCNLCDDCPGRIPEADVVAFDLEQADGSIVANHGGIVTSYKPYKSELFPMSVGRQYQAPEPVLHDQPQPLDTPRDHARRLLRLRSKTNNALEITEMFPTTILVLDRLWRQRCPDDVASDKKRKSWIGSHPFMQYLTHLLRIRLIPVADSSYRQCENVMEGIADL